MVVSRPVVGAGKLDRYLRLSAVGATVLRMRTTIFYKPLLAAAASAGLALGPAPAAYADEAAFVDYIHSHGINIGTINLNPSVLPGVGHEACTRLHTGKSPQQVAGEIPPLFGDGPGIVNAAQHTLCPDTL